jgi:DNA-binding NarL/FixJ family response regulator
MRKIIEHGCHKLAARELNLETRTVSDHAQAAGKKMGYRTSLMRYLEFDRWIRGKSE